MNKRIQYVSLCYLLTSGRETDNKINIIYNKLYNIIEIDTCLRNRIQVGQGRGDRKGWEEDRWQFVLPNRLVNVDTVVKVNWNRLADSEVGHVDIWEEHPRRKGISSIPWRKGW